MRRLPINITPTERLARVAVGLGGAIGGVWRRHGDVPRSLREAR